MTTKKLLYIGSLIPEGTCLMRFKMLREIGYEVIPVNTTLFGEKFPRIIQAIQFRLCWGPSVWKLNNEIVRIAKEVKPEIIWVDKGLWICSETLKKIRNSIKTTIVHYNPDDPFGDFRKGWRAFIKAIPEYDIHFVPRDCNIKEYEDVGAKKVFRLYRGFDPNTHHPMPISAKERENFGGEVGFIGSWEKERADSLVFLARQGIKIRIWGEGWNMAAHPNLIIENQALLGADYAVGICSFDINLSFLRKGNRDMSTSRSIEIPACGGFMLTERTDEHLALFEEGREAEFFGSDEELLDKVKYYLAHPEERKRIAAAGRERCLKSGYSYQDRLKRLLSVIETQQAV